MVSQISDACVEGVQARESFGQEGGEGAMIGVPLSASELEQHFLVYGNESEAAPAGQAPASPEQQQ